MEWISVDERLPEVFERHDDVENDTWTESDRVLVVVEDYHESEVRTAIYTDGDWDIDGTSNGNVILWKPLPDLPDDDESDVLIEGEAEMLWFSPDLSLLVARDFVGHIRNVVNEDGEHNYVPVKLLRTEHAAERFIGGDKNGGIDIKLVGME